jgi:ApbE superfamily uncharacterized protein (UPF0280 family)
MNISDYQPRTYRHWIEGEDLAAFSVTVQETDLYIRAAADLRRKAEKAVLKYREQLEGYIARYPAFRNSLEPLPYQADAPHIVRMMLEAGEKTGVGPMAAVAGAVAECVGKELLEYSPEIIVENGGDIFLKSNRKRIIGIYAGDSPLTGQVGLEIAGKDTPLGICTSSGTVGPSLSQGKADAVVVISRSTALADAAATAIGNRVRKAENINAAIEFGGSITGLKGLAVIADEAIGVWGAVKLCRTDHRV